MSPGGVYVSQDSLRTVRKLVLSTESRDSKHTNVETKEGDVSLRTSEAMASNESNEDS